jgi:hypothetical protein
MCSDGTLAASPRRGQHQKAIALIALFVVAACSTLPSIPSESCGNGVVEPENAEYCDSFAQADGAFCRPAGAAGACHFDCDASQGHKCPAGLGCGADSICRAASGAFANDGPTLSGPDAVKMLSADFDADRRQDLVVESLGELRVDYFDADFGATTTFRLPIERARATASHLTSAANADLILTGGQGVDVWRGQNDRTFAPTVFPSFPIPGTGERLVPIKIQPQVLGTQLLLIMTGSLLKVAGPSSQPQLMFPIDGGPELLAGDVAVGSFDESAASPCDELALAFTTQSVVHVFTPCRADAKGQTEVNTPGATQRALPDVALPAGAKVKGLRVGHIDADAHLDLLVDSTQGVFVAYGVGDGSFHSTHPPPAPNPASPAGDGKASAWKPASDDGTPLDALLPLAIGDLNDDGRDDLVGPPGVLLHVSDNVYRIVLSAPSLWTAARMGNLDGSHHGSFVAASASTLDVYQGTGSLLFNHQSYTASGPIALVTVADYDGDLVDDIAMRTTVTDDATTGATHDELAIMWGTPLGYPEQPTTIGRLPQMLEIVAAPYEAALAGAGLIVDGIADIAVTVRNADKSLEVAALPGRPDRQLTSPFALVNGKDPALFDHADHAQAFSVASIDPAQPPQIVCIAQDPAGASGAPLTSRIWTAPLTAPTPDTLSVQSQNVVPLAPAFAPTLDFDRAQTARARLDADAASDAAIALVPPLGLADAGSLVIARLKSDGWHVASAPIGGGLPFRDWRLAPCDVDGDGDLDLVALFGGARGTGDRMVQVLWNNLTGTLDPNAAATIAPLADAPVGIACANLDADAAMEIVILTANAALATKLDPSSKSFSAPRAIDRVAGGRALSAADFDGDGVLDLAIAGTRGVTIFPGLPSIK